MMLDPDVNKVEALLKDAITSQCKMGFLYQTSLFINARVMVTIDNKETVTMAISDVVDNPESNSIDAQCLPSPLQGALESHASSVFCTIKDEIDPNTMDTNPWPILRSCGWQFPPRDIYLPSCPASVPSDYCENTESPLVVNLDNEPSAAEKKQSSNVALPEEFAASNQETILEASLPGDKQVMHSAGKNVEVSTDSDNTHFDHTEHLDIVNNQLTTGDDQTAQGDPGGQEIKFDSRANETVNVHSYKHGDNYKCPFCSLTTSHGSALSRHLTVHTKSKISCQECSEEFIRPSYLRAHIRAKHGKKVPCKYCDLMLPSKLALAKHSREVHKTQDKTQCPYCSYHSPQADDLELHIQGHMKGEHQCGLCCCGFDSKEELEVHSADTHRSLKGSCKLRWHDSPPERTSEQPEASGKDSEIFQCAGCQFTTFSAQSLGKHLGKVTAPCEICLVKFVCIKQRKAHMRLSHPVEYSKKTCELCLKEFHSRQGLHTHRKVIHSKEVDNISGDEFTCHVCGKVFPVHAYLARHLKVHDDSEPYQCPKCARTFKYHRNFKSHKDGCLNTNGYPCQHCGKTLKNEYTLRIHVRGMHCDNKHGYHCQRCGSPFSYAQSRNKHQRMCRGTIKTS